MKNTLKFLSKRTLSRTRSIGEGPDFISSHIGISVLYAPADPKADIVFVHGLAGNSLSTWTARESVGPWPRDLLPREIPKARILTFGYDAGDGRSLLNASRNLLADLTILREKNAKDDTPIIFVAHSMGGIVVQECLCIADQSPEIHFQNTLKCTRGILFLGTPHSGTQFGSIRSAISRSSALMQNASIIESLRTESEVLDRIRRSFNMLLHRRLVEQKPPIEIVCFFEELPTPGIGLVVPKHSAVLPGYSLIGIHRNHSDMVRFNSVDDLGFVCVVSELRWMVQAAEGHKDEVLSLVSKDSDEANQIIAMVPSSMTAEDFNKEEAQALLSWLSPLSFSIRQEFLYTQQLEGTGDWFFETEQFKTWESGTSEAPLLWCHGIPGAGKSVMTSMVIRRLNSGSQDSLKSHRAVAYLYCDYQDQKAQTTINLLGSLAQQLALQADSIPAEAWLLYRRHDRGASTPTVYEFVQLLAHLLSARNFSQSFLVVDGLDELRDEHKVELVEALLHENILSKVNSGTQFSLYLSSREDPWIQFRIRKFNNVRLSFEANHHDLEFYVRSTMLDLSNFKAARRVQEDSLLAAMIVDIIVGKAAGMFLLVVLYLETLKDLISIRQIRQALKQVEQAPTDLSTMYDNAMARIGAQDDFNRQFALEILCWVVNAKRPLKFSELQHALAIQIGDPDIDVDGIVDDESYFVSVCDGLVIIDNESRTVRLVHHTLLEYLSLHASERFFPCAQEKLANLCLTYLLFDEFSSGFLPADEQVEAQLKKYPLLEYAAKYWGEHYRLSREVATKKIIMPDGTEETGKGVKILCAETNLLVDKFLRQGKNVSCAVQFMELPKERNAGYSQHPPQEVTRLWLFARFGLENLVEQQLLKEGISVDEKTSNEETALYAAVCRDHYDIVKILLKAGSNPRTPCGEFGNALQAASAMGFKNMIQLLLENGADINVQCGKYGTALQAAAARGHEDIISLLLENGAEVNALAGRYRTALRAASANGYETVVQRLLDAGADLAPKLAGNDHPAAAWNTSALSDATAAGSESIVRLLLAHGADPNGLDDGSDELRPLHKAVQSGNLTMVTLLLERGADLSANSKEGTALHLAASFGDSPMVRLLLEFGADIEEHDAQGRTPLLAAAEETDTAAVAERLLSAGANPEAREREESTALIVAATRGHEQIVRKLVENGANIEAMDIHRTTPLLAAADNGHTSIVRFLLDKGADPESEDSDGANALITAANNKHLAVVHVLLQHGVKFTRKIWESSALSYEAQGVLEKVVVKGLLKSPSQGRDNWEFLQTLWEKEQRLQPKESQGMAGLKRDDSDVSALKALGGRFWQTEPAEYSKQVEVDSDN